jgi:hypothetical protein
MLFYASSLLKLAVNCGMDFSQPRKSNTSNGTFVLGKNGNGSCAMNQGGENGGVLAGKRYEQFKGTEAKPGSIEFRRDN